MEVMFEFGLFPTVEAPGEARRRLAQLEPRLDEDSLSAVRAHGASEPIDAKLTLFDDQIEGVVEDHGPGTRAIVRAKKHRDSPLVLRIIDGLVREWGTDQKQTRVWFRMPIRRLG
jgi:hypothetical protein